MAREGTPDAQVIREVEPQLAAKGFRDLHIRPRTGREFGFTTGKMHVKFAPDPVRGIDIRNLWRVKKMPLIAGTSVTLNFKANDALEKHLGLCVATACAATASAPPPPPRPAARALATPARPTPSVARRSSRKRELPR